MVDISQKELKSYLDRQDFNYTPLQTVDNLYIIYNLFINNINQIHKSIGLCGGIKVENPVAIPLHPLTSGIGMMGLNRS